MASAFFVISFLGLVLSFVTEYTKRGDDSVLVTMWKYMSFYTTLSNMLVSVWFACIVFWPNAALTSFLNESNVATAVTFYITTVGIANYLIYGWLSLPLVNRLSDLIVHAVTPLITLIYWLVVIDKESLQYTLLGYWFVFPLGYAFYTMVHGKWTGFYPYEFTNVQTLGIRKVLLNAVGLCVCLFIGGALFIYLGQTFGQF